jgi:hypothetical protein
VNDQEWIAYLDTLPPELADLARHIMERINTVLNRDRNRQLSEAQRIEQRLDLVQTKIVDVRTLVVDLIGRVEALEPWQAGGSDA